MTATISILKNRRSYRNFKNFTIPQNHLDEIILASKQAPSSMNMQAYSIIIVQDEKIKQTIYELNPQNPQINDCSVFLVYVIDYYRSYLTAQKYGKSFTIENNHDSLITGSIDVALAMQNAIIASESLGYQSVCIGGVKMIADKLVELLNLPQYVFPVCGLCIGVSKDLTTNKVKPRYPHNVFINKYDTNQLSSIEQYDQTITDFAEARETLVWSDKVSNYTKTKNEKINELLKQQQF